MHFFNKCFPFSFVGFSFLQGYAIGQDVVQEIRKQTSLLAEYSLKMKTEIDSNFSNVHDARVDIQGAITIACKRIDDIDTRQGQLDSKMESITDEIDILAMRTAEIFLKRQSCISLNVLNDIEGVDFMKMRTGFVKDEEDANTVLLVDELGGLPLALEQAAAHIKSIKCSFEDYIKRFQKKRLKLLKTATQSAAISSDRLTVRTTWQLNIDYICQGINA
jgi:hypothetical protein